MLLYNCRLAVNLDIFVGSCNALNDLSIVCVPDETEDLNLNVFNIITGINEPKTLIKPEYISCKCECKFDGRKCNSNQKWNKDKCLCECNNSKKYVCKKDYIWYPARCSCENGICLGSIIGDLVVMCDEL